MLFGKLIFDDLFSPQRLHSIKEDQMGALYGLMYDGILLVIGMSVEVEGTSFQELQTHFPTEVDFCGIVTISLQNIDELSPAVIDNLQVCYFGLI